jgi:hypothetical protein
LGKYLENLEKILRKSIFEFPVKSWAQVNLWKIQLLYILSKNLGETLKKSENFGKTNSHKKNPGKISGQFWKNLWKILSKLTLGFSQ